VSQLPAKLTGGTLHPVEPPLLEPSMLEPLTLALVDEVLLASVVAPEEVAAEVELDVEAEVDVAFEVEVAVDIELEPVPLPEVLPVLAPLEVAVGVTAWIVGQPLRPIAAPRRATQRWRAVVEAIPLTQQPPSSTAWQKPSELHVELPTLQLPALQG